MTKQELIERIEKKKIQITKIEKRIEKHKKQIDKMGKDEDNCTKRWAEDDLRRAESDFKDSQITLNKYILTLNEITKEEERPKIEVVEMFLDEWEKKATSFYEEEHEKLIEYKAKVRAKCKEIENKYNSRHGFYKIIEEEEKQNEVDYKSIASYIKSNFSVFIIYCADWGKEWHSKMIKELADEKNNKRSNLIARVEKVVGEIKDANYLKIGDNGEINGYVIGAKGKCKVETISAGGYNIQCYHFRVLVKAIKE